ncbi:MAG: preprotein translocase subunit YajC [Myxococcota bacterium]
MQNALLVLAQAAAPQSPSFWVQLVPMLMLVAIFYFVLIRPQQKQQQEHQKMLSGLQQGDQVVTSGGIHGKVFEVGPKVFTLEIADKVRVKVNRENIVGRYVPEVQVVEPTKK